MGESGMNLKKTLVSLFAATAISLSLAAPLVNAQNASDYKMANVTLTESGTFSASIESDITLSSLAVNYNTGGTASGNLTISYVDTQSWRGKFTTMIQATDFNSNKPIGTGHANANPGNADGNYYISNSQFRVVNTNNVWGQEHCNTAYPLCPRPQSGYRVGDIGANGATGAITNDFTQWAPNLGTLDQPRQVQYGIDGMGTGQDTWGVVNVALDVPGGVPATTYQSGLLLTVTPGWP
jgi:hypothetical protein